VLLATDADALGVGPACADAAGDLVATGSFFAAAAAAAADDDDGLLTAVEADGVLAAVAADGALTPGVLTAADDDGDEV
jgi:hypothetical protein